MRILILEDDLNDLHVAADAARAMGIFEIDAFMWLAPAQANLAEALRGDRPLPNIILLDLAVGCDSGYELLREWHICKARSKIRMIVWSRMEAGDRERRELLDIHAYVGKDDGPSALRDTLRGLNPEICN